MDQEMVTVFVLITPDIFCFVFQTEVASEGSNWRFATYWTAKLQIIYTMICMVKSCQSELKAKPLMSECVKSKGSIVKTKL